MKEVELLKAHRHNGQYYKKGDVIQVSDDDANWLSQRGIAKLVNKKQTKQEVIHE